MNLTKHPPERRRRSVTLTAHGCCCCCCCCLHSLGGLIGSGIAGVKARTEEERRTVKVYWLLFLASVGIGIAGIAMKEPMGAALIVAALGLPVAQLNASFWCLFVNMLVPLDLVMLGRLTWKGFLYALIGIVIMAVPLIFMAR